MTKEDVITCSKYMAEAEKYSITVYIDVNDNYSFMNAGVSENCWPEDIKRIYGLSKYDNGEITFLDYDDYDSWSEEDKTFYFKLIDLNTAKTAFEERSKIGSRFEWPEVVQ